jgi:hypothetical protein
MAKTHDTPEYAAPMRRPGSSPTDAVTTATSERKEERQSQTVVRCPLTRAASANHSNDSRESGNGHANLCQCN